MRRALLAAIVILATVAPTASRADSASFQGLGFLSGYIGSQAFGLSSDGSVVVGKTTSSSYIYQAFRWTAARRHGRVGVSIGRYL